MKTKFRRMGRFTLPVHLANEFDTLAKRIMGQCIIVKAEFDYCSNEIHYWALSEHFALVREGFIAPTYTWVVTDGHITARQV